MKKKYQELEMDVIELILNDIISTAANNSSEWTPGGGDNELPFVPNN